MPFFETLYSMKGQNPFTKRKRTWLVPAIVWARDRRHLNRLIERRGLKEQIRTENVTSIPLIRSVPRPLSETIQERWLYQRSAWGPVMTVSKIMHNAAFLAMLAHACGKIDTMDIVGDFGFFHQITHYAHNNIVFHAHNGKYLRGKSAIRYLVRQIQPIERAVPGYMETAEQAKKFLRQNDTRMSRTAA